MLQQDYFDFNVRTAAILTNGYVAGTVIGTVDPKTLHNYNQLLLYVDFTIGSLTDCQIKIEFSKDNSDFYQETMSSQSAGVSTDTMMVHKIAATGKYRIAIPIKDRYIKVSAIGTGTVTTSSLQIKAVIGVQ
jgi:hypothetical protein